LVCNRVVDLVAKLIITVFTDQFVFGKVLKTRGAAAERGALKIPTLVLLDVFSHWYHIRSFDIWRNNVIAYAKRSTVLFNGQISTIAL